MEIKGIFYEDNMLPLKLLPAIRLSANHLMWKLISGSVHFHNE